MPKKTVKDLAELADDEDENPSDEGPAGDGPATGGALEANRFPVLPLRDLVIFPHMIMPVFIGREKSIAALDKTVSDKTNIVLVSQKEAKINNPSKTQIYRIGVLASVVQHMRMPDGTVKTIMEGRARVRVKNYIDTGKFFAADVEILKEREPSGAESEALVRMVSSYIEHYVKLNKQIPPEALARSAAVDSCGELADVAASQLNLRFEDKQKILEIIDPMDRLKEVLRLITKEIQVLKVERKIRTRVKEQMERTQKEYYLNEQLQAIQRELGDKDDFHKELRDMKERALKKKWPATVKEKFDKELSKLRMMSPLSAEASVSRNYLEWLLDLPWGDFTKEKSDIKRAEAILNEDHWGLKKVKERILERLAVRRLNAKSKGPVLCFVGPPGVGKTSLAKSIARALNRPYCRLSLGGIQDEAEMRGHRRTYVGALPGRVIQALKKVKKGNPVMLLDEVDKMGGSAFRGDPAAALLEILDPEQNFAFQDHYLEAEYDLSPVFFICTANSLHKAAGPLRDRMEVIPIEGYIEDEKMNIAEKYLIPKQMKESGLDRKDFDIQISAPALKEIISYHTKEAGVRQLERSLGKIFRKLAKQALSEGVLGGDSSEEEQKAPDALPETVSAANGAAVTSKTDAGKTNAAGKNGAVETDAATAGKTAVSRKEKDAKKKRRAAKKPLFSVAVKTREDVEKRLGPRFYRFNQLEDESLTGVANGLAWTETGGDTLIVETSVVPGTGKVLITGQLGDVMKESCSAALSYVRSRGMLLEVKRGFFKENDFHIHVPEGAVPKDGPSAGVAVATALVSSVLRHPVRSDLAMTGEITLRGRILPIGGLKEKALAAHRAKLKTVLFPKDNEKDLRDIPKKVCREIEMIPVRHIDEVLEKALERKAGAKKIFGKDARPPASLKEAVKRGVAVKNKRKSGEGEPIRPS